MPTVPQKEPPQSVESRNRSEVHAPGLAGWAGSMATSVSDDADAVERSSKFEIRLRIECHDVRLTSQLRCRARVAALPRLQLLHAITRQAYCWVDISKRYRS